MRRAAGQPPVDVHRVVLDAGAEADLAHHLDVVGGAHPQPLRLQQLALPLQLGEPLGQLHLDVPDRPLHPLRTGRVVGGREDQQLVDLADHVTGQRVQVVELLHLVTEQLDPDRQLLVRRDDLQRVAADPEGAPVEGHVVAGVLDVDQPAQQLVAVELLPDLHLHRPVEVFLRGAQTVDRRDGRHHDHVAAGEQRHRRRVPQPLHLLVDRGVLLDVGVGLRDVRLGLVVVVVGDEVFDRVVRQQLAELLGQLRAERLVRGEHQGGTLQPLDQPRRGGALARAGRAEQHGVAVAAPHPALKIVDGGRLVAGRLKLTDDLEAAVQPGNVERHAVNGTPEVRQEPPSRQVRDRLQYSHCVAHVTGTTLFM